MTSTLDASSRPTLRLPSGWRAEPTTFHGGYRVYTPSAQFYGYIWPHPRGGWQALTPASPAHEHHYDVWDPAQALAAVAGSAEQ